MKLLILLTTSFPYDNGEEFLLNEVNYINGFDKVLICPCNLKKDSVVTKKLPDFITCMPLKTVDKGRKEYISLLSKPYILDEMSNVMKSDSYGLTKAHEMIYFMKRAFEIYRELLKIKDLDSADEVTIYSYWLYDAAAAGVLLAEDLRRKGIKVLQVSRAHRFDIYSEFAKHNYIPMRKFILENIDSVRPCSASGADYIKKQYPKYANKIIPAFLGTADHGIKYGNRKNGFHIVTCSFMVPVKRLHLIVEALKLVDFPILWTHIGSGPLMDEIRNSTLNLPTCVKTEFKGQMGNEDIMKYYKDNDITVFINVSSSEGLPVSIMEAGSFGIPVIATNAGGTGEAVYDGKNGYLLDVKMRSKDLLSKLNLINQLSEEKYNKLCENSRKIWAEKFNAADNYKEFYKEISR